ncbi:MAG: DUF433 domain-containing protein [Planctomycetota bacterium]
MLDSNMPPASTPLIESSDVKCGGKPYIRGTRIRVWDIYIASELRRETPNQIAAQYPSLTLAQVHAALAYAWNHRRVSKQEIKRVDESVEDLKPNVGAARIVRELTQKEAGDEAPVAP